MPGSGIRTAGLRLSSPTAANEDTWSGRHRVVSVPVEDYSLSRPDAMNARW
jgi:hypothetical protein